MRGKRLLASVLMVVLFSFLISCGNENTNVPGDETIENTIVSDFVENSADSSMALVEDESLALQTEGKSPKEEITEEPPEERIEELTEEEAQEGDSKEEALEKEEKSDSLEKETDYESEIRNHYIAKKECEVEIQALLLGNLEAASYIEQVDESEGVDYGEMLTDAIISNSIDSSILSSGAKSAINAIGENKTIDEIMNETADGLVAGAVDEMKSTVQEALEGDFAELKNLTLFEEAAWIQNFLNVDDTPVGLLNGMVGLQRTDVEGLSTLLLQEEYGNGDLLYIEGLYKRLCSRQNEIILAGGTAQKMSQEDVLDELIEKWNYENSMIYAQSALCDGAEFEISGESKREYFSLRDFAMMGLPSCYDVAGYKTEQKYAEQSALLSQKILGDFLGSMTTESVENSQKTIQQEKIKFYELLEGSLENSYLEVCIAKSRYDILYDSAFTFFPERNNTSVISEEQLYEAAYSFLEALYKYSFDLKTAIMFWENTLSENETAFLEELKEQLNDCYTLVNQGLESGMALVGYYAEEQCARYVSLMDAYIDYLYWSMIYSLHEPVYSGVSSVTAYGVGNFYVYYQGMDSNPLIFAEEQMETNYHKERYLWVYDKEGNPIYIRERHASVYVMDNVVIEAWSLSGEDMINDDVVLQLYHNAVRIRSDFISGDLAHRYKEYVL